VEKAVHLSQEVTYEKQIRLNLWGMISCYSTVANCITESNNR